MGFWKDELTARVMTRSGYRADRDRASAIVVGLLFVGLNGDQIVIRFVPAQPSVLGLRGVRAIGSPGNPHVNGYVHRSSVTKAKEYERLRLDLLRGFPKARGYQEGYPAARTARPCVLAR